MAPKTILLRASAHSSILHLSSRNTAHPLASLSSVLSAMQLQRSNPLTARRTLTSSTQPLQQTAQTSPPSPPPSSSTSPTDTTTPPSRNPLTRHSLKFGTVLTAGRMDKTVRVLHKHTTYHKKLHKSYPASTIYLVSDPCNSLRQGDVIEFSSGWRTSKNVRHVVERIVAPFGLPVEKRPRVLSWHEREAVKAEREEKAGKVMRVGRVKRLVEERLELDKKRGAMEQAAV
ncbi:hypothetical protein AJ78_05860 [Emergomyces pasteurianus Ep9510]|uniref:Ribosomal protein S17 n=1 Tax=Emergomyces pasteurianus Ep9510 TaxID=1447872 RepID=A0A1J9QC31_9EURO|nr:hypothetical protein AJ78_05860 [Emergomyces pasteurianus Ep9510]